MDGRVPAIYPAVYRDSGGEEHTTIRNDGRLLTMEVRGVTFQGPDFDCLLLDPEAGQPSGVTLNAWSLCACSIETEIPIQLMTPQGPAAARLEVRLELGAPAPTGGIDHEQLQLCLHLPGHPPLVSKGCSGWFEDELIDLQAQLPAGNHLRTCFTCAYSDYSPAGHGLFGGLACFRDNKEGYRAVQGKLDLFRIWDTMTEWVQETYLCPEFELRTPGAGYRG